jgi:transposase
MTPPQNLFGIDVSKRQLDIAQAPCGDFWSTTYDESGIQELVKRLRRSRPALIVLEATGGYELPLVAAHRRSQAAFRRG